MSRLRCLTPAWLTIWGAALVAIAIVDYAHYSVSLQLLWLAR